MLKKIITWFFLSLGVIFFGLILLAAYLWFADPWGIKPFIMQDRVDSTQGSRVVPVVTDITPEAVSTEPTTTSTVVTDVNDKHPALTSGQEDALELIGVDPSVLPNEITAEQEACFATKLGAERVAAIKAGATPEVLEIFKAKECMSL